MGASSDGAEPRGRPAAVGPQRRHRHGDEQHQRRAPARVCHGSGNLQLSISESTRPGPPGHRVRIRRGVAGPARGESDVRPTARAAFGARPAPTAGMGALGRAAPTGLFRRRSGADITAEELSDVRVAPVHRDRDRHRRPGRRHRHRPARRPGQRVGVARAARRADRSGRARHPAQPGRRARGGTLRRRRRGPRPPSGAPMRRARRGWRRWCAATRRRSGAARSG